MDTVVKTRQGAVRGKLVEGIVAFKGIAYAAPPFGPRRFRPPQPAEPWDGVRDALEYGATVPKPPYFPPFDKILPESARPGEDCLNLNIWTPDPGGAGLPVMVWIHGGAFRNGTGMIPTYDGTHFARDGVVCVTINYRLGIEGFLYLGEGTANLGLLDQIAALQWVQENIAAFGGDPTNVTIFGESAGGMSVTTLLAMASTRGLFRRVIAQSGAGHHVLTLETARLMGRYIAAKLGVEASAEAFSVVPGERLLQAQVELANEIPANPDPLRWREVLLNLMPHEPVIDGEILSDQPIKLITAGAGKGVDVMVGSNADEYNFFIVPPGAIHAIGERALAGLSVAYGFPLEETLAIYRELHPGASPGEIYSALVTDWFFRIPAFRLAEARVAHGETAYLYEFAWRSPLFEGRLGSCHALELAFVFDNLHQETNRGLVGPAGPQVVADVMHASWVSFARYGDPGWPRYNLERRASMRFDLESEVVDDPHSVERKLWEGRR
ncbi:MAG TPA: carboxylesterase/lipase family protein [Ktedonobacteraceae bacterium]